MIRWLLLALVTFGFTAPLAFADKPRRGLQKFDDEATEVRDLNRKPSKMKGWVEEEDPEEFDFPWKQVLGALACFALAAPFAYKLYTNVNAEIASTKEEKEDKPPPRVRRKLTGERPSQSS